MAKPCLDEIATLLIQIEPGDAAGAQELRKLLLQMLRIDAFVNPAVLPSLAAALRRVEAAHPQTGLTQSDIQDLDRLVTDAMRLMRDVTEATQESPAPGAQATEPAPARVDAKPIALAPPAPRHAAPVSSERPSSQARAITLADDTDLALLTEFVSESREYLAAAESALLRLETDPDDAEAINTIFRAFHTIKGTSAFLALDVISDFAHHAESILSRVRDREIHCTGGYADIALRSVDMLGALLEGVDVAKQGGAAYVPADYDELLRILEDPEAAGISESATSEHRVVSPAEAVLADAPERDEERVATRRANAARGAENSVRVRTDRLDQLIDMVGELVIAQSMIAQDTIILHGGHYELARKTSHAGKIVRELQDLTMGLRMVPLKGPFQKVARVVRDVAAKNGKLVIYECDGEEVEIDRNLVDILSDPLVHMVRNAVDHGIEPPDVREKAGKPRTGLVRLSAYHAGGNVVVQLSDDGRGLDRQKIVKKAVAMGLIESGDAMTDTEVFNLIFAPGFSTAETVTDVSGRGVGMDVVRRNIERTRGRVEITSTPGKGTTFTVRLPLTLAITDGMLVRVGPERYIVPIINIQLSFRPEVGAISTIAGRAEMVMLRGDIIPVVRLHRLFDIRGAKEEPTEGLLMIVGDGDDRVALLVDELLGQQQVVAKSLGQALGEVPGLSGSAILGDGRVGLILDVQALVTLARGAEQPAVVARSREEAA